MVNSQIKQEKEICVGKFNKNKKVILTKNTVVEQKIQKIAQTYVN